MQLFWIIVSIAVTAIARAVTGLILGRRGDDDE